MADPLVFHYKDLSNTIKLTWAQMNQNLRSIEGAVTIVQDAEHNTSQLENSTALLRNQAVDAAAIATEKAGIAVDASATAVEKASVAVNAATAATNKAGEANQSAIDADQSAADAAQSAGEAQASASSIDPSVDPAPNKIPISDDSGTIKQGWVKDLDFELDALRAARLREQYGDGLYPILDLNFQGAKVLDPKITYSRASKVWDFDLRSQLKEFGIDDPAFAFDPVTGKSRGLQVMGQRTNLAIWSGDATKTVWSWSGSKEGGYKSSLGGNTAVKAYGTGGNTQFVAGPAASKTQHYRFVFKPVPSDTGVYNFHIRNQTKGQPDISSTFYIADSRLSPLDENRRLEVLEDGFFAVTLRNRTEFDIGDITIFYWGRTAATTDPTWGIIADYIQVEAGNHPTLYIPTDGSQVTVARTSAVIEGGAFTDFFNPDQGTFVMDVEWLGNIGNDFGYLFRLNGPESKGIGVRVDSEDNKLRLIQHPGGAQRVCESPLELGERVKFSVSYTKDHAALTVNGTSLPQIPITATESSRLYHLILGAGLSTGHYASNQYVRSLRYYDRALTDAECMEMTA